jgi:hypothetical protein
MQVLSSSKEMLVKVLRSEHFMTIAARVLAGEMLPVQTGYFRELVKGMSEAD